MLRDDTTGLKRPREKSDVSALIRSSTSQEDMLAMSTGFPRSFNFEYIFGLKITAWLAALTQTHVLKLHVSHGKFNWSTVRRDL